MPLVHSEKVKDSSRLLVWHLTESQHELNLLIGAAYNFEELNSVTHPQKKREWLASRMLIKLLTEELGVPFVGTYKDDHGKVFLHNDEAHISITHTLDYVAAVLDTQKPVGIDMEKLDAKLHRTSGKFLSDDEHAHAGKDLQLLAIYWCAKEAIYKLYGKTRISFKNNIQISAFETHHAVVKGVIHAEPQCVNSEIHIRWFDDYCLAIAL
jgi:4'-phosphopantetheinyl transferase